MCFILALLLSLLGEHVFVDEFKELLVLDEVLKQLTLVTLGHLLTLDLEVELVVLDHLHVAPA